MSVCYTQKLALLRVYLSEVHVLNLSRAFPPVIFWCHIQPGELSQDLAWSNYGLKFSLYIVVEKCHFLLKSFFMHVIFYLFSLISIWGMPNKPFFIAAEGAVRTRQEWQQAIMSHLQWLSSQPTNVNNSPRSGDHRAVSPPTLPRWTRSSTSQRKSMQTSAHRLHPLAGTPPCQALGSARWWVIGLYDKGWIIKSL